MPNDLQKAGASGPPTKFGILHQDRFMTGLWTQRSPLRDGASPYLQSRFYGGRYDSMIDGSNVELTNKLTLARRPGNSVYNSQTFDAVDRFHSFRYSCNTGEHIRVLADTASAVYDATGPSTKTLLWTKSAGAGKTSFLDVGNVLFMGNGKDQVKWVADPTSCTLGSVDAWGIAAPTDAPGDAPLATFAAPCRYWAPNMQPQLNYAILDINGNVELLTNNQNAASFNSNTVEATVSNNGTVPANLPVSVAGASPTVNGFTNPTEGCDGNPNSSASAIFQHTNAIGVCTWGFSYTGSTPVSLALNVMSGANAPIMLGSPMTAGVWYSLNGGTTWTAIWSENVPDVRAKQWNNIPISAGTTISNILVCAYVEAHDDAGVEVYDVNLLVGTNTIPTATTGDKTTGATTPTWNTSIYGLTTDGTAIWQNMGPISQWRAHTVYSLAGPSASVIDSNGNLQVVQTPGFSGASQGDINGGTGWAPAAGSTSTDGTVTWLNVGLGNTVAFTGWDYVYAYHKTTGEVSTSSPASEPTGPVLGSIKVLLSGVGSADTNCDKIWIFRTLDGGSTFFFDFAIDNPGGGVTWNATDTNPDSELNEFILAAIDRANDPPPVGFSNLTFHLGRIWGSVGNQVFYSRIDDATAGSGTSSFPPLNFFTFPSAVTRLWAGPAGLMVFTVSDVYLIVGQATSSSPVYAVPFLQGIGLLSYDALDVNGSIVYLYTADGQLISFDPNAGVPEIGFPIGDLLSAQITPASAYVTWHVSGSQDKSLYISDGATGWYRMNPTSAPETGLSWSPKATIVGGCSAVQSIEVTPGVKKLLVGPASSGPILNRDLTTFADNSNAYPAFATFGSIILALPGQMSEVSFVTTDCMAVGSHPTLGIRIDEISGSLESLTTHVPDPPQLPASGTIFGDRFYFTQTQAPAWCRHLQMQVTWPTENAKNELLSFTIFGASRQER